MYKLPKTVLMVAYFFPPLAGGGVQRTTKFIKYLPGFGWKSVVLTSRDVNFRYYDPSNIKDIPEGTPIYRASDWHLPFSKVQQAVIKVESSHKTESTRVLKPLTELIQFLYRNLFILGGRVTWILPAAYLALEVLKKNKIDLIYTTSFPMVSHVIGLFLKRKTGLPWVVDFRDPWTQNVRLNLRGLRLKAEEKLEQWVVQEADAILSVSAPIIENLEEKYPFIKGKTYVIPNGFDPDDFKEVLSKKKTVRPKFVWVYTGILYETRSPRPFLNAVKNVLDKHPNWRNRYEIRFVGDIGGGQHLKLIEDLGLQDIVKVTGYVSHQKALKNIVDANALLLIIDTSGKEDAKGIFTGKIFEYIVAEKPILTLSGEGVAADLIEKSGSGRVHGHEDVVGLEETIEKWFQDWEQGKTSLKQNKEVVKQYSRQNLTRKLAEVFNKAIHA